MGALEAVTDAGERFVRACDEVVPVLAEHAAEHDRDGTFPSEGLDAATTSGLTAAPVPVAQGGWGMRSAHDLGVGVSRLAGGDASFAIAGNMHLAACWTMARAAEAERAEGGDATGPELLLAALAQGAVAMVNATEPGTDTQHPFTEVVVDGEHAVVSGTKIFSTLSPAADVLLVSARSRFEDGGPDAWQTGFALVGRNDEGVTIRDDWDALGMRASGSGSITYDEVRIPAAQWLAGGPLGEWTSSGLAGVLVGNIGLVCAFLGIAEAARTIALEQATRVARKAEGTARAAHPGVRRAVAEIEVALASARATIERAALAFDALVGDRVLSDVPVAEVHEVHAELQAAKLVVQEQARIVVDTAMTVAGGSSYLSASPLSRLYRDVRAGPFMQPFSPIEAWDYIGRVALGTLEQG